MTEARAVGYSADHLCNRLELKLASIDGDFLALHVRICVSEVEGAGG